MQGSDVISMNAYKRRKRMQEPAELPEDYTVMIPNGMGATSPIGLTSSRTAFCMLKELHDDGVKNVSVYHKGDRIFPPHTGIEGIQVV